MSKNEELAIAAVEEWRVVVVVRCLFLRMPAEGIICGRKSREINEIGRQGIGEDFSALGDVDN
jgi:hypothetical protein